MAITTIWQLQDYGLRLTESVRKAASELSARSDLFLSHSSRDERLMLNGAIKVLSEHGASVYADILDPDAKRLSPGEFGDFFCQAISDTSVSWYS